jgi:hypothetical protein
VGAAGKSIVIHGGLTFITPVSPVGNPEASRPDVPVWILTCETLKWNLRMDPGEAVHVEALRDSGQEFPLPAFNS